MLHMQGASKHTLLTVVCGGVSEDKQWQDAQYDRLHFPLAELASNGRLEVGYFLLSFFTSKDLFG